MKRCAAASSIVRSSRVERASIVPELPPELWELVMAISKNDERTAPALSMVSKTLRTLFFDSVRSVFVSKTEVYNEYSAYEHLYTGRNRGLLGIHSCSIVSECRNAVELTLRWMPSTATFADYASNLRNLRTLRCRDKARIVSSSLPNPSKLVSLEMERSRDEREGWSRTCDDDLLAFTNLQNLTIFESGKNITGSCFSVLTNICNLSTDRSCSVEGRYLSHLRNLSSLDVRNHSNDFGSRDIVRELASLDNVGNSLTRLIVESGVREKPYSLNSLTNLKKLQLCNSSTSYERVSRLTNLKRLELAGKPHEGYFAFPPNHSSNGASGLSGLKTLFLEDTSTVDVSGFPGLNKLLMNGESKIANGSAESLGNLRALRCYGCKFLDADLIKLTNLRSLYLRKSEPTIATCLSHLTDLTELTIYGSARLVTNSNLYRLADLVSLKAWNCPGVTEECLSVLTNLTELMLDGCRWKKNTSETG